MSDESRELELEHGLCVAVGVPASEAADVAAAALRPEERAFLATLGPARRGEWIGGRLALARALERLGAPRAPLLPDERGAPRAPAGFVGSISHKRTLAVAIAARDTGHTVGVDVEELEAPRLDIRGRVLTAPERSALDALPEAEQPSALMIRFAIKEAIYKAIDPYLRRYVGFREVTVTPGADGVVAVELAPRAGEPHLNVAARWQLFAGRVLATAQARRVS